MSRRTATLIGLVAILLWACLALATTSTGAVPPFLLTALTFAIGGTVGVAAALARGVGIGIVRQPWPVWLHGIGGLFGYHFFYFSALKLAPPAEAGLIAYLWPLLIVLLSALLPGERLRPAHVCGAMMGLAGTAILLAGKAGGMGFAPQYAWGYAAAAMCAVIWSVYSVLSRRFHDVPTELVAGFCLATAALSALCHVAFEPSVWPQGGSQWLAVVALGIGPVGIAFYAWDIGMKRGDIRLLGVASYAAPVLSTLLLVLAGDAAASWSLAAACALIVGGAVVATLMARNRAG
ncbi:aromatic amino acid exporter YddG [Ancylobacter terrae]|uniref:aromatic amino acid exporter YddG n=1 Tax=Ancylobacter sp. sgz301288 TaxID=3342077 RepID=UPI00385E0C01